MTGAKSKYHMKPEQSRQKKRRSRNMFLKITSYQNFLHFHSRMSRLFNVFAFFINRINIYQKND